MTITTIWARAALPGFHRWPDAAGTRSYLADRHRHLFVVTATVSVNHDDRDVEFHDLQDIIRAWWGTAPREWGPMSCEGIAMQLFNHLNQTGMHPTAVEVSEDNESGAIVRSDA